MKQIESYVDEVYHSIGGNKKEIEELKAEMKNHLLEAVSELKSEGKSEQEAINIAIERFGGEKEVKSIVTQLFKTQSLNNTKKLAFILSLIGATLGLIIFATEVFLLVNAEVIDSVSQVKLLNLILFIAVPSCLAIISVLGKNPLLLFISLIISIFPDHFLGFSGPAVLFHNSDIFGVPSSFIYSVYTPFYFYLFSVIFILKPTFILMKEVSNKLKFS